MPDGKVAPEYRGWLSKWTNYLKGYQKRWFVLNSGLLSYYRFVSMIIFKFELTIGLIIVGGASHSNSVGYFCW